MPQKNPDMIGNTEQAEPIEATEVTREDVAALQEDVVRLRSEIETLQTALRAYKARRQARAIRPAPPLPVTEPLSHHLISGRALTLLLTLYLPALILAELTMIANPFAGSVIYSVILVTLSLYVSLTQVEPAHHLFIMMAFPPLIRLISLAMPSTQLSIIYEYALISIPVFLAARIALNRLQITWSVIGYHFKGILFQLLVASTGFILGYAQYLLLQPEPLIIELSLQRFLLAALILLIATGFIEELVFRGIMQRTAVALINRSGIIYIAAVYTILHIGYQSVPNLLFVFVTSLYFGWIVLRTQNLVGISICHGIMNIMLLLIMPSISI